MSLKNYIFSSINTKGYQDSEKFATLRKRPKSNLTAMTKEGTNVAIQSTQAVTVLPPKGRSAHKWQIKRIFKFWRYISVEILMLCWLLPSCFLYIAIENLALEKVRLSRKF